MVWVGCTVITLCDVCHGGGVCVMYYTYRAIGWAGRWMGEQSQQASEPAAEPVIEYQRPYTETGAMQVR